MRMVERWHLSLPERGQQQALRSMEVRERKKTAAEPTIVQYIIGF